MPRRLALALATPLALAARIALGAAEVPQTLSLAQAVEIATGKTTAVRIADLKTREAEARRSQARGAFLPGLAGSASTAERTFNLKAFGISFPNIPGAPAPADLIGPVDVVDARVRATQTLFDVASWMRVGEAGDGVRLSDAERGLSAENAAQGAALTYLRVARAQSLVEARSADLDLAGQLLELAQEQRKAGVSPGIDVTRAQTQVASARGRLVVARNELERARIELARALGLDPDTRFQLTDSLSAELGASAVPARAESALALALERRPELRAERLRLDRARAEKAALSAERLPRIEAAADYGLSGDDWPGSLPTRQVSVAVSVPFLDGLRREARISEQRAVMNESEVRGRDLQQQIGAEVSDALLDLASGRELLVVAAEGLRLADEELAQARDRFVNGVANNIEVINAQSSLIRARDADIDARFAIAAARVSLARAAGVGQTLH